jgi:hypothetical protein
MKSSHGTRARVYAWVAIYLPRTLPKPSTSYPNDIKYILTQNIHLQSALSPGWLQVLGFIASFLFPCTAVILVLAIGAVQRSSHLLIGPTQGDEYQAHYGQYDEFDIEINNVPVGR